MQNVGKPISNAEPSRLIHRTVALNFAAQLRLPSDLMPIWLGLVDDGADRWVRDLRPWIGLPTYFFHFKISRTVRSRGRRFMLGGEHLDRLSRLANGRRGQAFYVLPMIENLNELAAIRGDVLSALWLLDVADLMEPNAPADAISRDTVVFLNPPHVVFSRGGQATVQPAASLRADPLPAPLDWRLLERSGVDLTEPHRYGLYRIFGGRAGHWAALVLAPLHHEIPTE